MFWGPTSCPHYTARRAGTGHDGAQEIAREHQQQQQGQEHRPPSRATTNQTNRRMQPGYTRTGAEGGERGMMGRRGGGHWEVRPQQAGLVWGWVGDAWWWSVVNGVDDTRRALQTCLACVQVASCMHFWELAACVLCSERWVGGDLAMRLLFRPPPPRSTTCAARRNTRHGEGCGCGKKGTGTGAVAGWFGALEVG